MNWITVFGFVFTLIGIALLIAAARQFGNRRTFLRESARTSGVVVALAENREGGEISYFPEVEFKTSAGRVVRFQSGMGSSHPQQVGDIVFVRYRPEQPLRAEIDSFMSLWGTTLVFAVLGTAFEFVGIGILSGLLAV